MSEVDKLWASNRARELADEKARNSYRPSEQDTLEAQACWAREFKWQFDAYTQPMPFRIVVDAEMPADTIEFRDATGKRLGRIVNIGQLESAPPSPKAEQG